ncbi:nucleoside-diphosphate-sugar epimerase [Nocardioides thalensis]|uniref:Nucleoside-diphosphate-sugar epimerase n=1 Tax=Nocardioides thalensis TaxID=1914755 RepID=A0A853BWN6_9ACTN|nr:NAD-dependent epimerase/dehydratase family protein [Nocardioides thalensis]NYI99658.1 nucleoside-diphosphate-sugar epimerase [Nocardioides thalensis]
MTSTLIVGAGATGSATALLLAGSGHKVRLVTRRGTGPRHPAIELVRADASDADRLKELAAGTSVIFNCAMPAYHQWPELWPPLAVSMLGAAEAAGADLVMLGNGYGYGDVDPMTEDLPMRPTTVKGRVRAAMWLDALAAHEAGRVRVTEVRAADYLGPAAASVFNFTVTQQVLAGEPATYPAPVDVPHAWTATQDVARLLVAAAFDDRSWGRAWHVPNVAVLSVREVAERLTELTGSPRPTVTGMTRDELVAAGADDPILAELVEMLYLDEKPLVFDSTITRETFGLEPSQLDDVLLEMSKLPPPT